MFQRKKLEMYSRSLEKDDKLTPQVGCFISFKTLLNETHITNIRFSKSERTFTCCPELYFFFKYLMNLRF